jgi:GT2 family glycosyltransferase
MQDNNVAIAILFYNKLSQTIDCVNSFLLSCMPVYVLNNGSDSRQWASLKQQFDRNGTVFFLDAGRNLGVAGGRNFLVQHTTEPWLLFADNDIMINQADSWLSTFRSFLKNNPEARIVSPRLFNVHENAFALQLRLSIKNNRVAIETGNYLQTNCFSGGASFVHRSIFESYGFYDENLFVGFEDYEYALRAAKSRQGELQVYACNEIELIHDHQIQHGRRNKEAVRKRYDEVRLKLSYQHLVDKHNILFEHDWEWWCRKQVLEMTGQSFVERWKYRLKNILRD